MKIKKISVFWSENLVNLEKKRVNIFHSWIRVADFSSCFFGIRFQSFGIRFTTKEWNFIPWNKMTFTPKE